MSASVDIMEQFIEQFKKENMLGFFQFHHSFEGKKPVSGLCKLARAKKNTSGQSRYLSLVFLVDIPDSETKKAMDAMLDKLTDSSLKKHLREIEGVTPMPTMVATSESYVRHLDIMLSPTTEIDRDFVESKLLPVVRNVAGFSVTEDLIWWEDLQTDKKVSGNHLFFDKLKKLFGS